MVSMPLKHFQWTVDTTAKSTECYCGLFRVYMLIDTLETNSAERKLIFLL